MATHIWSFACVRPQQVCSHANRGPGSRLGQGKGSTSTHPQQPHLSDDEAVPLHAVNDLSEISHRLLHHHRHSELRRPRELTLRKRVGIIDDLELPGVDSDDAALEELRHPDGGVVAALQKGAASLQVVLSCVREGAVKVGVRPRQATRQQAERGARHAASVARLGRLPRRVGSQELPGPLSGAHHLQSPIRCIVDELVLPDQRRCGIVPLDHESVARVVAARLCNQARQAGPRVGELGRQGKRVENPGAPCCQRPQQRQAERKRVEGGKPSANQPAIHKKRVVI